MPNLSDLGRALLLVGGAIVVLGLLLLVVGRIPLLGRLTGDINVRRGNSTFYFPVVTGVMLSVALIVVANLALWLLRRH